MAMRTSSQSAIRGQAMIEFVVVLMVIVVIALLLLELAVNGDSTRRKRK